MCGLKPRAASMRDCASDRLEIEVPQNSLATTGERRIVEVGLQVGDVVAVHVAAEDDDARHLRSATTPSRRLRDGA